MLHPRFSPVRELERTLLEQAIRARRPLLMLALVLLPRRDEVCLHEPLGVHAVLEQAPALPARAPPCAADRLHRLAERVGALEWHAVLDLHEHRPVPRMRLDDHVGLGPGLHRAHVDRPRRAEAPASRDRHAAQQPHGNSGERDAAVRLLRPGAPYERADRLTALEDDDVEGHAARADPVREDGLRRGVERAECRDPGEAGHHERHRHDHYHVHPGEHGAGQTECQRRGRHHAVALPARPQPRQQRGAEHRADAHRAEQEPVSAGAELEVAAREDREQRPQRAREQDEDPGADEDRLHAWRAPDVARAGVQCGAHVLRTERLLDLPPPPHEEHSEHSEEGDRVDAEDPRRAGRGHQRAAERRADGAPHVHARGAERGCLGNPGAADELWRGSLPRRRRERTAGPDRECEAQEHPRRRVVAERERGQKRGRDEHEELAHEQHAAAVEHVADGARGKAEEEDRQARRLLHGRDLERGVREVSHQPLSADRLHPRADVRRELGDQERAEDGDPQRRPRGSRCIARGGCGHTPNDMSTLPTVVLTVLAVLLIAAALRDVFDTLFHETGRAVLSSVIMRGVWRAFRRLGGRQRLALAGPISLIAVVMSWAALLIAGWALLLIPHMPDAFSFSTRAHSGRVVESIYLSLTTLTTVGFGDIAPAEGWVRLVPPLEALIGFGLLTASVSWLLSIYPLLSRRRSLAYEIHLLTEAESETDTGLTSMEPWAAESVYSELMTRLVSVERDMVTFPVAYYFTEADSRFALPAAMPSLLRLAEAGCGQDVTGPVRLRATMLREAIGDFARTIAARFHGSASEETEDLLEDYARDHLLGRSTGDATARTAA